MIESAHALERKMFDDFEEKKKNAEISAGNTSKKVRLYSVIPQMKILRLPKIAFFGEFS